MKTGLVATLLGLAGSAFPALLTDLFSVEAVNQLPDGWTEAQKRAPSEGDVLPLSIAIRHDGIATLKKRLDEISDPRHASYGKHLSREEVRQLRTPPRYKTKSVLDWLEENGIPTVELRNEWIHFDATVSQVKKLFGADMGYYSYQSNVPVLRTRAYGLPRGPIAEAVQFVHPLTNFVTPRNQREHAKHFPPSSLATRQNADKPEPEPDQPEATADPDRHLGLGLEFKPLPTYTAEPNDQKPEEDADTNPCVDIVTPECLRQLYNINYEFHNSSSPSLLGVAGFLEQYVYHEDTKTFLSEHAPGLPNHTHDIPVELVNGGENPQVMSQAGLEASLDVQYAIPLGYPSRIVYYSTGGRGVKLDQAGNPLPAGRTDNEPYLEFVEHLLDKDDDDLPHVISISYADDEQGVPKEYALKVCDLFAALTARGVSIISATGDGGARGVRYGNCLTNDGKYDKAMIASFPATCPYVTAIGAVHQQLPPEVAEFSTGGFSIYFDQPAYQNGHIDSYLKQLNGSLDGLFNQKGRAVPDLAAVGSGFTFRYGGGPGTAKGTSAATPVIASMFSLINDARMRAGKSALGWLNPMLYTEPVINVLQDVVNGESAGCAWDDGEAPGGWPALRGYDCGTGLGIPHDFEKLMEVFVEAQGMK